MVLVGATSSLVLVAFLVPLALLVRTAAAEAVLNAAILEVQALAPIIATTDETDLARAVDAANAVGRHAMTVFLPDGVVLGPPSPRSEAVGQAADGQSVTAEVAGGREIAVAVAGTPGGTAVIRTFVADTELETGVGRSWSILALLGLGLLLVSMLVADLLARTLTRPLTAVARVSHRLAQGSLGARAVITGPPEIRQVSAGLNHLAERITQLLAQERATVADLSHRLRTPLTALRIDVESVADPDMRARLVADLDAVDRTVDAVIREAGRPAREGPMVNCDARTVIADRVAFWSILADDQRRRIEVALPSGPVPVGVSPEDLSACLDALIGNVFTHTPDGTSFRVSLDIMAGGGARMVVADEGPGLPDGSMLQRGASGGGSTGLGLDIVVRTATRSGGDVTVDRSPAGGAAVAVRLGPVQPPTVRSHRDRIQPG
jgi:signal transduction histidine kinase